MPNTWIATLDSARACGTGGAILTFNTGDRVFDPAGAAPQLASLVYFLAAKYHAEGSCVGYFSLAGGFRELVPPGQTPPASSPWPRLPGTVPPSLALRTLDPVLRDSSVRRVLIIDYADHLAPASGPGGTPNETLALVEHLHSWSLDDEIKQSGNYIVLISRDNALHPLIQHQGGFRVITVPLPDEMLRLEFTEHLLRLRQNNFHDRLGNLDAELTPGRFANITGGLRLLDIEELFLAAGASHTLVVTASVRERKKTTIRLLGRGLVEVIEAETGFEAVAGCRHAKDYFSAIKPLWIQGHASVPQGILCAGVPGSGKSYLIKGLAKELDVPCLILRGIREMWVGQSERNLETVLEIISNTSPCLLWTEEIDQQLGGERSAGSSGDSGTSERMFGRILEYFGDARVRGRILWVATTNRPHALDIAIKDRFAIKIPFIHPTSSERAALLPVLAAQIGRRLDPDVDCTPLAEQPELEWLSARSLQEIINWAGMLADRSTGIIASAIRHCDLAQAISDYMPSFDPVEQELIALIALSMTSFSALLPWVGCEGFKPSAAEWPSYLDSLVDVDTGKIQSDRLSERIAELQRQLWTRKAQR